MKTHGSPAAGGILGMIDNVYESLCGIVQHHEVPAVVAAGPPKLSDILCKVANRCLCDRDGKNSEKIRKRLDAASKSFQKNSSNVTLLAH
eukprot:8541336-Pyramimonas_sp.AAC.1